MVRRTDIMIKGLVFCVTVWLLCTGGSAQAVERHVNPRHPGAVDAGSGASDRPYRTIEFAMRQLEPGDHLFIVEGTYREALRFPDRPSWESIRPTIIEGQGRVLIKASDVVDGWTALGEGRFVSAWPRDTAQVFVDGVALQQIGGSLYGKANGSAFWPGRKSGDARSMPLHSFFHDKAKGQLHLRLAADSLEDRVVEVSVRPYSLLGTNLKTVAVRNLEFQHGNASPFDRGALVAVSGDRIWLDRIRVSDCDAVGIEMVGNDNTLSDSSANRCGQLGLRARGARMLLERNETNFNNTRGFDKWWEAGGAKFVGAGGLRDSRLTNHRAIGNFGDGIWFDWDNRSNRIENNVVVQNSGFGIHYEASSGGIITNNVVVANGQRGIYLLHSSSSVIAFNLVAGNGLQGIAVVDEGRHDPAGRINMRAVDNKVFGNVLAWNRGALVLPQRNGSNDSDANLFIGGAAETNARWGWAGPLQDIGRWIAQSGQDASSLHLALPALAPAVDRTRTQAGEPYVSWFRSLRPSLGELPIDAEWMKLVPGRVRDRRPGPTPEAVTTRIINFARDLRETIRS